MNLFPAIPLDVLYTPSLILIPKPLHFLSFLNTRNYVRNTIILQKFKHIYGIGLPIKSKNLDFKIQILDEISKIGEIFNHCFVFFYRKNRDSNLFIPVSDVKGNV